MRNEWGTGVLLLPRSGAVTPVASTASKRLQCLPMSTETGFEWDAPKDAANVAKHGVAFETAQRAFLDPSRVIAEDLAHLYEKTNQVHE